MCARHVEPEPSGRGSRTGTRRRRQVRIRRVVGDERSAARSARSSGRFQITAWAGPGEELPVGTLELEPRPERGVVVELHARQDGDLDVERQHRPVRLVGLDDQPLAAPPLPVATRLRAACRRSDSPDPARSRGAPSRSCSRSSSSRALRRRRSSAADGSARRAGRPDVPAGDPCRPPRPARRWPARSRSSRRPRRRHRPAGSPGRGRSARRARRRRAARWRTASPPDPSR